MEWFEPLIWTDYRLAVLFTVSIPFTLLIWAFIRKVESIQHLLMIYWRVASLLLITLYLMIGSNPVGYIAAFFARILIPLSLWFWQDINDELEDMPSRPLKLAVTSWRWGITFYSLLGLIGLIPFIPCGFSNGAITSSFCQVWLKTPWLYKSYFHADGKAATLAFFGLVGLMVYIFYLGYFLLVRLPKQGRSAMEI